MNIELTGLTAPRKLLNILVHVYNQRDTTQATKDYIELELRRIYKGYDIKELLRHPIIRMFFFRPILSRR